MYQKNTYNLCLIFFSVSSVHSVVKAFITCKVINLIQILIRTIN